MLGNKFIGVFFREISDPGNLIAGALAIILPRISWFRMPHED